MLPPDRAAQLVSGKTFARLYDQESCGKPDIQRQVRVVEYRSRLDAELVIALFAVKQLLRRRQFHRSATATWALGAVRPAQARQKNAAFFVGIK